MVVLIADKNLKVSLNNELSFKYMKTVNKTGYEVKLDVYIIDTDTLCVEILKVE